MHANLIRNWDKSWGAHEVLKEGCCYGAGAATRSYLYIDDVVEAYDMILHQGTDGQTYNIGSQVERSVLSVAHDVLRIMQLPTDHIKHVRDRAFNDRRYFVCDRKLAKLGAPCSA